jgi:FAD/FMN-containing dehydrogenase
MQQADRCRETGSITPDPAFLGALADIVGPKHVIHDARGREGFEVDWRGRYRGQALAVVAPPHTAALAEVVRLCARAGVAMVPQGGNTGLCGGATPDASGRQVIISLRRMTRLRSLDADDAILVCEAGMPLAAAQDHAAAQGLLLPLSIASEGSATIGGTIATNAGGVNVLHYGSMRRLVLGVEAVLPDGGIWSDLGGLRKDNTGYAVSALLAGSEGTLGIITAASLSLAPRPSAHLTFLAGVSDLSQATAALADLRRRTGEAITAWEVFSDIAVDLMAQEAPRHGLPLGGRHPWYLLGELSMFGTAAARQAVALEDLAETCAALGIEDIVTAGSEAQRAALWALREGITEAERTFGPSLKHDIAVRPSRIAEVAAGLARGCAMLHPGLRMNIFGHVGDGNLHVNALPIERGAAMPETLATAVTRLIYDQTHAAGGSFSAEHGVGQAKCAEMARYKDPAALCLMNRIKAALDPEGLFNPGKVLP